MTNQRDNNRRVSRWLLLLGAVMLGACNADNSVFEPAAHTSAVAPVSHAASIQNAAPVAGVGHGQPSNGNQPARGGTSRYAMAAN